MRPLRLLVLAGLASSVCLAAAARTESATTCGLDPVRLEAAVGWAMEQGTDSLLIVRGDCIAAETYARGASAEQPQEVYSITKAMTAVLLGMALEQGVIESLDLRASHYFPEWGSAPRNQVTLRHLATMTSGLVDPGASVPAGLDPFAYVRLLPLEAEPGARWRYNNWSYRLLFPILAQALGKSLPEASRAMLFEPLGMENTSWVAFAQTPGDPPLYVRSTARDVARFGRFLLQGGEGLVSKAFLDDAARPSQGLNRAYGLLFWLNSEEGGYTLPSGVRADAGRLLPSAPPDLIAGFGARRHKLLVIPSLDLVIVRFGEPTEGLPEIGGPQSFENQLFERVARALPDQTANLATTAKPKP